MKVLKKFLCILLGNQHGKELRIMDNPPTPQIEYFKPVYTKNIYSYVERHPSMIKLIIDRFHGEKTLEEKLDLVQDLKEPYKSALVKKVSSRKCCSMCKEPLPPGEVIWSWGEFNHLGKWKKITHFCVLCYNVQVRSIIESCQEKHGQQVILRVWKGSSHPRWLAINQKYRKIE